MYFIVHLRSGSKGLLQETAAACRKMTESNITLNGTAYRRPLAWALGFENPINNKENPKMNYFTDALKKYADFTGRARRKEYWMFILIYMIISITLSILGLGVISKLVALGLLVPSISIATRRLHDTGRSGWWQLIVLIPLIGLIILIVFLAQDGHADNDYGVNPKTVVQLDA